jgi:bifunctional ADP-heptose synthase (sugar kinase/adenylyltransferase)
VFNPIKEIRNAGMAGGLYDILSYYGCNVDILTNEAKIEKIRYIDNKTDHYFLRVDKNDEVLHPLTIQQLSKSDVQYYDFVIVSDYNKGFLTEEILAAIPKVSKLSFLDSKKKIDQWADFYNFIKTNKQEYLNSREYLDENNGNNLIVTLGENGAKWMDIDFPLDNKSDIFELSAAGDVFHASFAFCYFLTKNVANSIKFANTAASWHVTKRGTHFAPKQFDYKTELQKYV